MKKEKSIALQNVHETEALELKVAIRDVLSIRKHCGKSYSGDRM